MADKKTKSKPAAKKAASVIPVFSKVEACYLENNSGKTAAELAGDLGRGEAEIAAWLAANAKKPKKTLMAEHPSGAVAMTAGQSYLDDDLPKNNVGANAAWLASRKNCIHIMDPDKPVR